MREITPNELKIFLDNKQSLFLKLWKPGCGACRLSETAIEKIEESKTWPVEYLSINTEAFPGILNDTGVDVVPAFFAFANGELCGKQVGFKGIKKLETLLEEAFQ